MVKNMAAQNGPARLTQDPTKQKARDQFFSRPGAPAGPTPDPALPTKGLNAAAPDLGGLELDARRLARLRTAEKFKGDRTPLTVLDVAECATALAEEVVDQAKTRLRPPALACKEGCDWCCYQQVGTAAPEVFRIIAYLRQALSPKQFEEIRERVIAAEAQRRALKAAGRSTKRLPCALLVEHRCVAYAVRPLTCRGFNSRDARCCELSLDPRKRVPVPLYTPQLWLNTFVLDGMRAGLDESRLKGDLLELTRALRIALEEPDSVERWLAGQPVFAAARMQ